MFKTVKVDYSNTLQADDLIRLMSEYALDPMGGACALPEFSKTNLVSMLSQIKGAFSILAYDQTQAIGLINCFEGFSTFNCQCLINIHDVIVTKSHRRTGVAELMLKEVEREAEQRNACKITLEVLNGNLAAVKTYQSFGFSPYQLDPAQGDAAFWEKKL